MLLKLSLLIGIILGSTLIYLSLRSGSKKRSEGSLIRRFRNNLTSRQHYKEKFAEVMANSLLIDPDKNIPIGSWNTESDLREKADIHRARLNKYGRSRINGEMLYTEGKGKVYKYISNGSKQYL